MYVVELVVVGNRKQRNTGWSLGGLWEDWDTLGGYKSCFALQECVSLGSRVERRANLTHCDLVQPDQRSKRYPGWELNDCSLKQLIKTRYGRRATKHVWW